MIHYNGQFIVSLKNHNLQGIFELGAKIRNRLGSGWLGALSIVQAPVIIDIFFLIIDFKLLYINY